MHTPRIFTSPAMSGYAYSGFSSKEYRDNICAAITSGTMSYDGFLKVLRECVAELRNTFSEIRGVDAVFAKHADRVELLASYLDEEGTASADPAVRERVLHTIIHSAYDMLHDCATAQCNKEVPRFMDPDFTRREVHLQIAKVCAILVNAITMANCYVRTIAEVSDSAIGEADEHSAFHANMALSAYVNAKFSALSRCLNSSPGSEETKRRKAILRVVRHNIELCNKVAELVDPEIPYCFRDRTASCLNSILDAVKASSAECVEIVRTSESAQRRLAIARKATLGFTYYLKAYRSRRLGVAHDYRRFKKKGGYACALVHMMGSLFSMYRGYAAAGNAEHIVASKIERCIKILFTLYRYNARRSGDLQCKAREVYADMLCVYAEINEHIRPDLLLNPHAEIRWRDAALQYCTEMMDIWKALHGRHLDVFEQPEGSPSQPSTSGLGSAGAGIGGSQASYTLPHDPRHIPDSDVQPSTSAEASSALQEAQVASHRSRTPSNDDLEPSSKRSRSA